MPTKRKQNTPKKYPNEKGKINPRIPCQNCAQQGIQFYLKKASCQYTKNGKRVTVNPLSFCVKCRHVEWNEEELKKIPD